MADYSRNNDFSAKDALTTGNPNKLIKGSDVDAEFDDIVTMSGTKADKAVPSAANNVALLSLTGNLVDSGTAFYAASGQAMLFYQAAAPTGWTKNTTAGLDDHALRVVTSTSWTTGSSGTNSFTDTLGSGAAVSTDGHALTIAEMPAHTHTYNLTQNGGATLPTGTGASNVATNTGSAGSNDPHSHTLSVDIQYLSFILASKD